MSEDSRQAHHVRSEAIKEEQGQERRYESLENIEQTNDDSPTQSQDTADVRRTRVPGALPKIRVENPGDDRCRVDRSDEEPEHRRNGDDDPGVGRGQDRPSSGRGETATAIVPGPTCAPTTAPSSTRITVAEDGTLVRSRSARPLARVCESR